MVFKEVSSLMPSDMAGSRMVVVAAKTDATAVLRLTTTVKSKRFLLPGLANEATLATRVVHNIVAETKAQTLTELLMTLLLG
jgi:hypothetical protein